jgi:chromosome partitioning protein
MRLKHDLIIIDNGSGMDMDTRTTMRHADLTIIPVQPSPADVWATEAIVDYAEKERYPVMLVMNRVTARSRLAGLFSSSLPFLSNTMVGNRIVFAYSLKDGLTAIEEAPRSSAAKEIANLVSEIRKYMPKRIKSMRKNPEKELEVA